MNKKYYNYNMKIIKNNKWQKILKQVNKNRRSKNKKLRNQKIN